MRASAKIKSMIEDKSPILNFACKMYNHLSFGNKFHFGGGGHALLIIR